MHSDDFFIAKLILKNSTDELNSLGIFMIGRFPVIPLIFPVSPPSVLLRYGEKIKQQKKMSQILYTMDNVFHRISISEVDDRSKI